MTVSLFKKTGTYQDKKDGNKTKRFTNFYVLCGDQYIPVEPTFFPNPKCQGRDPDYTARKAVLEAFAAPLPPKEE